MIYVDFDGVLFNSVERAIDQWRSLGWHTGTYEEWTHWNKFQDWGLPSFRPYGEELDFYDLKCAGGYTHHDMVQDLIDADVPFTVLTHCTKPEFAEAKRELVEYMFDNSPLVGFASVERSSGKAAYCTGPDDVLIDDYPANCVAWANAGGTAVMLRRPWNEASKAEGSFHLDEGDCVRFALSVSAAHDDQSTVLEEAASLVNGDRQNQYGPPDQDFTRTAEMWNALFGGRGDGQPFRPQDVATAMVCIKLSRQTHQNKRDNWVDIAGYAYCGNLCMELEREVE